MKGKSGMRQQSLAVLALASLLIACSHKPDPVYDTSVVDAGGTLLVEIWASDSCVQTGDTVHLRATVTNKSAKAWQVALKDQPVLDIIVGFNQPKYITRWSDGKAMTPDLTRLELNPGKVKTIEMDWQVPKSGPYGPMASNAQFMYGGKSGVTPLVLIDVGECVGWLGP